MIQNNFRRRRLRKYDSRLDVCGYPDVVSPDQRRAQCAVVVVYHRIIGPGDAIDCLTPDFGSQANVCDPVRFPRVGIVEFLEEFTGREVRVIGQLEHRELVTAVGLTEKPVEHADLHAEQQLRAGVDDAVIDMYESGITKPAN